MLYDCFGVFIFIVVWCYDFYNKKVLKFYKVSEIRNLITYRMKDEISILVVDSGTNHTILRDKRYFLNLKIQSANVHTITGVASLIEGHGQAYVLMPKGTHLEIKTALYFPSSRRSLLGFKDIRLNGFHLETWEEENKEFLNIISITKGNKKILETIPAMSTGLYYAEISMIEANA